MIHHDPNVQVFGAAPEPPRRPLWRAMWRGACSRCPRCGQGALYRSFAKSVDQCNVCGEHIHHHRADDLPAYLNVFIVGHIVVAGFLMIERATHWPAWAHFALWIPVTIVLAFALIPPIKGAVIGLQWANRMHGFGGEDEDVADPDIDPSRHG